MYWRNKRDYYPSSNKTNMKENQSSDKSTVNFGTTLQHWVCKSICLKVSGNTPNLQITVKKISGAGRRLWRNCSLLLLPWRATERGYQLVLAGLHSSEQGDIKALCCAKLPGMFWGWGLQTAAFVCFSPRDITGLPVITVLSYFPAFLKPLDSDFDWSRVKWSPHKYDAAERILFFSCDADAPALCFKTAFVDKVT